ncbi:MAG: ribosomal L7Ae/L30e/S12e/Gadd45 family protein, partial [Gemmatimonadetes bacterium]|nr:ribosomal L7Ae/L30e/S12e/Gadd45 family protein [Gemmatimonadota bacterium]
MTGSEWTKVKGLLGLGLRARTVVVGVEQVRAAVAKRVAALALVADDASVHSRGKVLPLLKARRVEVIVGVTAAELGSAVGRETTAAVAGVDAALARGIRG